MNNNNRLESFKAIIIGFNGVGKTSLKNIYFGRLFEDYYYPTMYSDFLATKIKVEDIDYSIQFGILLEWKNL